MAISRGRRKNRKKRMIPFYPYPNTERIPEIRKEDGVDIMMYALAIQHCGIGLISHAIVARRIKYE
jgi:hypothetical protein